MSTSRKEFISEAEELLSGAQELTLQLQETLDSGAVDPDTVNALFRDMHTLKGLSGLFGLQGITELSHRLESLLDDLRLGKVDASQELCDFVLRNVDILRTLVKEEKGETVDEVAPHVEEIEEFISRCGKKDAGLSLKGIIDDSILNVLSEYEEHRLKANIREGKNIFLVRVVFPFESFDRELAGLTEKIKEAGELLSTLPTSEDVPAGHIGFNLLVGSASPPEEMEKVVGQKVTVLYSLMGREKQKKADDVGSASLKSISTTVRVDIEKLDRILNTIGELNLAKGAVKRIGVELFQEYGYQPLIIDTYKVAQSLERWVVTLQDQVLDIRMIPIGQIFSRLAQVIRRYSRQMNKKITLRVFGEDTNIDKYLAEEAVDPLMHIVRNAIDHGMESEDERLAAGKPAEGTITLKAFQRGNHVVVEVRDDGRGIDLEAVRKKAVEKGLIAEGGEYSDKEILELIFLPGFSTAARVTEVSGRGVGMDVAKEKISSLGGFVSVDSIAGEGTTVAVTLPITLAILKALMIRVGRERFAIPLSSISESFEVEEAMLQSIEGRLVANLRGELLPVVFLGEIFDVPHGDDGGRYVVVVGYGDRKMGFLVDELFGQHEIVIKALGEYFDGLRGFAGATEIGKHEIVLVVDVEAVIESALSRRKEKANV